jgi:hypothetical protein
VRQRKHDVKSSVKTYSRLYGGSSEGSGCGSKGGEDCELHIDILYSISARSEEEQSAELLLSDVTACVYTVSTVRWVICTVCIYYCICDVGPDRVGDMHMFMDETKQEGPNNRGLTGVSRMKPIPDSAGGLYSMEYSGKVQFVVFACVASVVMR